MLAPLAPMLLAMSSGLTHSRMTVSTPSIVRPLRGGTDIVMQGKDFELATRLRGEVEDPFAKFRLFAFPAAFAGAAIATYFGATSALAEAAGLRPSSPDTFTNLAADIGALGAIGFFWRKEAAAEEKRLKRIAAGAAIAGLKLQQLEGPMAGKVIKLVDLRSGRGTDDPFGEQARRVVVLCAEEAALATSLAEARQFSERLVEADLLIVPLVASGQSAVALPRPELINGDATTDDGAASAGGLGHLALPQGLNAWDDVLADERDTAAQQDANAPSRGLTLILKKNGRVGTRRLGLPDWGALCGDVANRAAAGLDTTNI